MKKILLILALFTMTGSVTFGQKAYEGKIKYKKAEEPAIVIEYNYPREVVENALKAKMADLRLTGQETRGILTYPNSVITSITPSKLDYTFKTEQTGKSGNWKTTLYMLMEGAGNISGDAVVLASNAKSFLESLNDNVRRSNTILEIKKQEAIMVDEEQKLKSLQDEYSALEKKMEANKQAQAAQEKVVASQKSILDDLKAKN
ncbi:hypothetical protein A8C56_16740 [Niabella ginsenosidivorans]|uniref:Uncharacterized protein n=1 Tax=Niabella ginsenosidivorans TaxID=1176587 RepID=A0A1A9I4B4_9BACT|nr:hypothetical protein [Niabella ginsenosidivorans]ANH82393.1 hypothetical protein A8C56_16740 [Niabella ginsenosidivorans]